MKKLDVYYRAYIDYRKNTKTNNLCVKERRGYKKAGLDNDKFEVTQYTCHIEEEWISEIEKGLVFVEKAIAEERQFIRTNSEVVPIEKIKNVSKHTVEHLARHAELITHVPEDGEIIPDKLLMVEKLSDYAVYENRFLYMLLCYLKDFLSMRINKIRDLLRSYKSEFNMEKEIKTKKRVIKFSTQFNEDRTDNDYYLIDDETKALFQRILDCEQIVLSFLKTPLMVEVAKTPKIKPPITKTNVLKMNNNFKGAVSLYEYVVNYNEDGFTSEETTNKFTPFTDKMADEFVELTALTSFLSYKYGNNLEEELQANYEEEEKRRKEEEERQFKLKIKKLKKRILEEGMNPDEYLIMLEQRVRDLEYATKDLEKTKKELEKVKEELAATIIERDEYLAKTKELEAKIEEMKISFKRQIEEMKAAHEEEINTLVAKHEEEINDLVTKHEEEINTLVSEHEAAMTALEDECNEKLEAKELECNTRISELEEENKNNLAEQEARLTEEYENKIEGINNEHEAEINAKNSEIEDLGAKIAIQEEAISNKNAELLEANNKNKALEEEKINIQRLSNEMIATAQNDAKKMVDDNNLLTDKKINLANEQVLLYKAEMNALRIEQNKPPHETYFEKERFAELEETFNSFNTFFKEQWKYTKKYIRKQLLWSKHEKPTKLGNDVEKLPKRTKRKNKDVKEELKENKVDDIDLSIKNEEAEQLQDRAGESSNEKDKNENQE